MVSMDHWTTEATKRLVESYHDGGLLTTTEAAELKDLVDRGMPDIALALLDDIDGGSNGCQKATETEGMGGGIVMELVF